MVVQKEIEPILRRAMCLQVVSDDGLQVSQQLIDFNTEEPLNISPTKQN